jgi:hypothetical protein
MGLLDDVTKLRGLSGGALTPDGSVPQSGQLDQLMATLKTTLGASF